MPTLKRSNYNIHYVLDGPADAPLLVLSNSLGAETSMWDAQMPELTRHFRVLCYDNRGHGQSMPPPPAPYSIEEVANDAALLLEELGETAVHFCGLSLGGMVGMWLATHRPDLIQKLVLCNTSAMLGPRQTWDSRIASARSGGLQTLVKGVMERWFTESFRTNATATVSRVEENFLKVSVEGYTGCCAAIRDMDQRAAIRSIRAKTLVIGGTFDPSTPPAMGQLIADEIPGARYVELPTAHLSNIEGATTFNHVVSEFLTA